jgi:MFS transporter, DHA3 family, macrolide efflux protein
MKGVLKLPAFRRLLASTVFNEFAYSIGVVALSLLIYRRTGSAIGSAGFFLCSQFAPALVSPWFVARLDQRSVRRVLGWLYILEVVIFLVLAWLVGRFSLAAVLALVVAEGVVNLVGKVLARAAWTHITLAKGLMREAQAVNNFSFSIAFMAGPAVGGVIITVGGTAPALIVNASLFALLWLIVVTASGLPAAGTEPSAPAGRLKYAVRVIRSELMLRRVILLQAAAFLFFMSSTPVEVVFAGHSLHVGSAGYGGLLSAWGAGYVAGSAIYARWRDLPSRTMIILGTAALGVGLAIMAAASSLAVACAGAAVAGIGNGAQAVAVRTAVQEATPHRWTALVLGLYESVVQAIPGAAFLLGGSITALAGPRPALAVAGAGCLAVALATRLWLPVGQPPQTGPEGTELPANIGPTPVPVSGSDVI